MSATVSPVVQEFLKSQRTALQRKVNRRKKALEEAQSALDALEKELKQLQIGT